MANKIETKELELTPNLVKNKLQIGEQYTYKSLCEILSQKTKSGTSKTAQLKDWERYFSYTKEKTKFTVEEIYDTPREDLSSGGKFSKCLEVILVDYLYNQKEYVQRLPKKHWYVKLGMCNPEFMYDAITYFKSEAHTITKTDKDNFCSRINKHMSETLNTTLKRLQDKGILIYRPSEYNIQYYLDEENMITDNLRPATDEEIKMILDTEYEVFLEIQNKYANAENPIYLVDKNSLNIPSYHYIRSEFYKKCDEVLYNKYHVAKYYKVVELVLSEVGIKSYRQKLQKDILSLKLELNDKIVKTDEEKVDKLIQKNMFEESEWRNKFHKKEDNEEEPFGYKSNYSEIQSILRNKFIKIGIENYN